QDAGWEVLRTSTGEDAVLHLQMTGHRIDIVFTNVELTGKLNGWDVADVVRARFPELPVIYASSHMRQICRQVPDSRLLRKPYKPPDVVQACLRFRQLGYNC